MAAQVIHFGGDDCHRVQVLRWAGFDVHESDSLESLREYLRGGAVDAIILAEDSRHADQAAAFIRRHTSAPLILFRRHQFEIDERNFDRVYQWLVPPAVWLTETAELIAQSQALRKASAALRLESQALRAKVRKERRRSKRELERNANPPDLWRLDVDGKDSP